ncbi:uncharacterized protein PHALS_09063 [Plasmopara halstedii]|uniref:Uncharacterized protein n=1 Tax=Plasmopara halstedii TaxID=4781 RepID=A0A0P1AEM5_PLAHL|nr:uncharacterized protein PHALS_09063 [Plasmopara halstedii]CEG38998.1 hypothetical protein PHALS_09063 [Plasmopara halstedii]|eukprot:XP_024575367.1 hypothetical protein PHALS_09063 [Plasmopara halstedii]
MLQVHLGARNTQSVPSIHSVQVLLSQLQRVMCSLCNTSMLYKIRGETMYLFVN